MGIESYIGSRENSGEKLKQQEIEEKEGTLFKKFRVGSRVTKLFLGMMVLSTSIAFGQMNEVPKGDGGGTNTVNAKQTHSERTFSKEEIKKQEEAVVIAQKNLEKVKSINKIISQSVDAVVANGKIMASKIEEALKDQPDVPKKTGEVAKQNSEENPINKEIDNLAKKVKVQENAAYDNFKKNTGLDVNEILKVLGDKGKK